MRKMAVKRRLMVLMSFVTAVCLCLTGCSSGSKNSLKFSTGGTGGIYYQYGGKLAELLSESDSGFSLDVQSSAGSASNIRLLSSGLADLGIVQNDILKDAVEGSGAFADDGPQDDIRAIAGLYTESLQIGAAKSAGIQEVGDLKGKKVSVGEEESGVFTNAEAILSSYGLTMDDIAKMYAEKTTTGISRPTDNTVSIELGHDQTVVLSGLKDNTEVIFADLSGKVLLREKVTSRTTTISTTSLPAGTYIIKTSFGETLKFTKQ